MASGAELIRQVKDRIKEIDPREVRERLDGDAHGAASKGASSNGGSAVAAARAPVIVDVREQHEFEEGHIPGAVHVPRGHLESRIEGASADRSAPMVLYCASGNRSALAADTLERQLGYENVESMTGGITLWKDRGYDVEVPRALTPEQRSRYSRHLLLPEVGLEGQIKLLESKVLLLGAGGLGSPVALYLAAAGVGTLGIVDDDLVDVSNLQRQVIHTGSRVGEPKVDSAEQAIRDVDNFPTRYLLNDATVRLQIPVVSASILGFDGQLAVFKPYDGPCYRCLYPTPPPAELAPSCGANGVLGVLPGTMGLLQATEVIKLITGAGDPLVGRLVLYDALAASFTELKVRRDPECPICSRDPEAISEEEMGVFPDYEAFCAAAG
jgi:molybdopterin/thiamine biosynthesis adenylyltransferase/rhodanese-related sulfurtransferase